MVMKDNGEQLAFRFVGHLGSGRRKNNFRRRSPGYLILKSTHYSHGWKACLAIENFLNALASKASQEVRHRFTP